MPFTKAQLDRITAPDLIPATRVPHLATRIAESFLKRRLFVFEDAAVLAQQRMYREAYADLRLYANVASESANLSKLGQDRASQDFKNRFMGYVEERLNRLTDDVAAEGLRASTKAWYASYFGRLWLLDVATREDVRIPVEPPPVDKVARQTLQRLKEDVYDDLIRDLLGREWRDQYATELDDLILRIRRSISSGMSAGEGISDIMRRVRSEMGVETDRRRGAAYRANFNRVQVITRTVVNQSSNDGAVEAYRRNVDVLSGFQILTARDERVCPICRGHDGRIEDLGSSFRPPFHPQCRCTVIPVVRQDILVEYDAPPRQTMSEWADSFGLALFLSDFLSVRRLESERI
jgi:SPP1 gp7 family putative phage head morphogenesis protein